MAKSLDDLLAGRHPELAQIERDTVCMDVFGGNASISFTVGMHSGRDPQTNPGVSFELSSQSSRMYQCGGKWKAGMGIMRRADAKRLRDLLDRFLIENPV